MYKLDEEHYNADGSPKKCSNCGCTDFDIKIIDTSNGIVCEHSEFCVECKENVAYWSYGSYDPSYGFYEDNKDEL